jgi:simple sugar transport system ATP-binding protein
MKMAGHKSDEGALAAQAVPRPAVLGAGLSKAFGATQALRDVTLKIQPGEVRALVGRNGAGKSTLVSVLTGLVEPDAGTVHFSGEPAPPGHARDLWQRKVACVYQHSKIIPTMSCAENLFLSTNMSRRRLISWHRMRLEARKILDEWGLHFDTDALAGTLTVGQRQLLEIARALIQGSRFLILDEPTAKLDGKEVDRLFAHVRELQFKGVGILYISHHLDEIFDICQNVTVLRDGQKTLDRPIAGLTRDELIEAMVGAARTAALSESRGSIDFASRRCRLDVRDLSCSNCFENVSFRVHAGECVGLAGIAGSGKETVGEALAGLRAFDSGTVSVDGTALPGSDVSRHNRAGIGFVPQDRHGEGLVLGMSVAENATMTIQDQLGPFGFIRPRELDRVAGQMINELDIKTAGPMVPVSDLSGGNQQKVVLARALARRPGVLVLINPTSGVDVASKAALFESIREVSRRDTAVLIISDELEELELCDRVLVIRSRRLTREFAAPWSGGEVVAEMEGVGA